MAGVQEINKFAYDIIQQRKLDTQSNTKTDLLSQYINARGDDGKPFSDKYLRDIILNILFAV